MKYIKANLLDEAFIKLNMLVVHNAEYKTKSRLGNVREVTGVCVEVLHPHPSDMFKNPNIYRISEQYANVFFNFLIEGGTDAQEAFKEYPKVAKFLTKPKSKELPENFNTFYGPRIKAQLPAIIDELKRNPDSRRAVIHILSEADHALLNKDETLEYPCTDSITFLIRDGELHMYTHMRSQNCAIVMQLDFFLMSKLLIHVAHILNLPIGTYNHSIVSAHVYEKDLEYVKGFLNG